MAQQSLSTVTGAGEDAGSLMTYFAYTGTPSVAIVVEVVVEFYRKKPSGVSVVKHSEQNEP